MIVVDSSVLIAALVAKDRTGRWCREQVSSPMVAPALARVECTNRLRQLSIAGELADLDAGAAFADLADLDLVVVDFEPVAKRVWELRSSITAYDAWYVAVAESLELPLATLDRRLTRAPGPRCSFLTPN